MVNTGRTVWALAFYVGEWLLEAQGKPAQALRVALHNARNIMTLLLAGEGNQPGDIVRGGDRLLLDLDDDIARAQSRLRRSTVCRDLRHDHTVARRVIAPRQMPAGADRGGCGKRVSRRRGPRNFLDRRRDDQRFVVAPNAQADNCAWLRMGDRTR